MANKNTKRHKRENPGRFTPRKSTKPKVAASAEEIMRRLGTGK
jgi:hypothetical protein